MHPANESRTERAKVKHLIYCAILLLTTGCSSSSEAHRVLSEQGFTNIHTTGYSPFACSDDDSFQTGFTATSPTGQKVKGTVCSGFLKGATVRFK